MSFDVLNLNGEWKAVGFYKEETNPDLAFLANDAITLNATVPGNIQLDLSKAGILPEDLYFGQNIQSLKKYELYQWWYKKEFDITKKMLEQDCDCVLEFEGVDTIATYYLNNKCIGSSFNMLIGHSFDINGLLKQGKNELIVRIDSPIRYAAKKESHASMIAFPDNFPSLHVRQAPHMYGWDIMPRAVTSGIWKDVSIKFLPRQRIDSVYLAPISANSQGAWFWFNYNLVLQPENFDNSKICIEGRCGDSVFTYEEKLSFNAGTSRFGISNPKLWYPVGYGEQPLYDVKVMLYIDQKVVDTYQFKYGIRKAELRRDIIIAPNSEFTFYINETPILIKGTNHVPLDAFHSRDKERYKDTINDLYEANCNLIRCWGGNVYESDEFFDMCDRLGILVWQDFAMACHLYPTNGDFALQIKEEVKKVVKRIRNHPSLIVYAGDNECDFGFNLFGYDPAVNAITRKTIPEELFKHDPIRPFLPSSPYYSTEVIKNGDTNLMPETHLWGSRDYYKSDYYKSSKAHFVSEIGYSACPSLSSIKRFISKDNVTDLESEEAVLHSTSPSGINGPFAYRNTLIKNQSKLIFGSDLNSFEDFVLSSQICQAEAKKFFIENCRQKKFSKSGIVWWNIKDGWPQFSDAVIDWYGTRKLAYYYIKQAQQHVCVSMGESEGWGTPVYVTNDTLNLVSGKLIIKDCDELEVYSTNFVADKNSVAFVANIPTIFTEFKVYLLTLVLDDGQIITNHYTQGSIPFDLSKYKTALKSIAAHYKTFDADKIAK